MSVHAMTAEQIARAVATGQLSAVEVAQASIDRVVATDARVNAFTGRSFEGGSIPLGELLDVYPVALLVEEES